jgi:hypothetical protein
MTDSNPFDEEDHTERIDAIELLNTIRPQSRPSWSPEIDRLSSEAVRNGWTLETLSRAIERDLGSGAGPGVAMMLLRRLSPAPPPRVRPQRQGKTSVFTHIPCKDPSHRDCQVCYCEGEARHTTPTVMPEWFRTEFRGLLRAFEVPSE